MPSQEWCLYCTSQETTTDNKNQITVASYHGTFENTPVCSQTVEGRGHNIRRRTSSKLKNLLLILSIMFIYT